MTNETEQPTDVVAKTTEDGSITLFDPKLNVTYRSIHGAQTESEHVFLGGTRLLDRAGHLRVLELGFGGATNFTITAGKILSEAPATHTLHYHSFEHAPVDPDLLAHLPGEPGEMAREALSLARQPDASAVVVVTSKDQRVTLELHLGNWREHTLASVQAHAIFHDPFGPAANPEEWGADVFEWERHHLAHDGVLATYGASTRARRSMFEAGLVAASLPGPGKKREITIAARDVSALSHGDELARSRYIKQEP